MEKHKERLLDLKCQCALNDINFLEKRIELDMNKSDEILRVVYEVEQLLQNLSDEEMDFEMKKKVLKAFYSKVNSILKVIDENRSIVPSVSEEDVSKLREYIDCCKSGVYN